MENASPISIMVIDNYDSFVYNLVHYLEDFGCQVSVCRNDELHLDDLASYTHLLLSPGPGIPEEAGLLKDIIHRYGSQKNILGICLGQQAIAEVFGGTLRNLDKVYHGVATQIRTSVPDESLFSQLGDSFMVGRYHSWVVDSLPDSLEATSFDENGEIMSLRHRSYNVKGVQFHPESVLTPQGKQILWNWLFAEGETLSGIKGSQPQHYPENNQKPLLPV